MGIHKLYLSNCTCSYPKVDLGLVVADENIPMKQNIWLCSMHILFHGYMIVIDNKPSTVDDLRVNVAPWC